MCPAVRQGIKAPEKSPGYNLALSRVCLEITTNIGGAMKKVVVAALAVFGTNAALADPSPSFDCRKATTTVEHMICADEALSAADRLLVRRYNEAMAVTSNKRELRHDQDAWRETKRDLCQNIACVRGAYANRNEELAGLALEPERLADHGRGISVQRYFAYFHNPVYRHYVLLARAKCQSSDGAAFSWQRAAVLPDVDGGIPSPSCWTDATTARWGSMIRVCRINPDNKSLQLCMDISKDKFRDTRSLPQLAF